MAASPPGFSWPQEERRLLQKIQPPPIPNPFDVFMADWFPALRASLARRLGPYLPPHPMRSLSGAALAALLLWTLAGAAYVVGSGLHSLWVNVSNVASSMGEAATNALKSVPRTQTPPERTVAEAALEASSLADTPPAEPSVNATVKTGRQPLAPMSAESVGVRQPYPQTKGEFFVREPLRTFDLPYAEGQTETLGDSTRQHDYALSQTFLRLGMDFSRLELLQSLPSEARKKAKSDDSPPETESPPVIYLFQRMRVHLSGSPEDFVTTLKSSLAAWAERSVLEQTRRSGRTLLRLLVDGVLTHEIFLQPGGAVFVPPPRPAEPRLTIVIDDMGANMTALRELLALDLPITFSILPHTAHARETAETAAAAGQEVLLHQPMEAMQSPYISPGPNAILLSMTPEAQREVLRRNMALLPQIVGTNNHMGSRATKDPAVSRLVSEEAAQAGLFVLDSLTSPDSIFQAEARKLGITAYRRDFFIDDGSPPTRTILSILKQAEQTALRSGQAIVIGHPRPETIAALREWLHQRNPDVAVTPLRYQL